MSASISSLKDIEGPVLTSPNEGYVFDQMEGAVDTALFLAPIDIPLAVIGARGTGKGFIARLIHEARDGQEHELEFLDCREFRGRASSLRSLSNAFESTITKTLVFKSPHLLQLKVQESLARCVATRTLVLKKPAKYLQKIKMVALFPASIDRLIRDGLLSLSLGSCFSAYPILVPPLRERGHAVLRWADKILVQESKRVRKKVKGFSPDAQEAMLAHSWTGNISELRHRIVDALESTSRDWLMPVDLGISPRSSGDTRNNYTGTTMFAEIDSIITKTSDFSLSARHELEVAIKTWCSQIDKETFLPLAVWLQDELVLASIDRYKGSQPKAASWLQVSSRNIRRWIPAIEEREKARRDAKNSNDHTRLIREWVRESPREGPSPVEELEKMILLETLHMKDRFDLSSLAGLMGVSIPTYRKKINELQEDHIS